MDSNGELFTNRAAVFEQIGRIREVPRGTLLSGSDAYWLKKGVCALTCVNAGGKEYSFLYFEEGMLFGFVPRPGTVLRHKWHGQGELLEILFRFSHEDGLRHR